MMRARGGTACPHCKHNARIRKSEQMTPVYREVTLICTNEHCGHVFVCALEAIRTLSPSAVPDPEVNLPMSKHVRVREIAHQMQTAMEQADD